MTSQEVDPIKLCAVDSPEYLLSRLGMVMVRHELMPGWRISAIEGNGQRIGALVHPGEHLADYIVPADIQLRQKVLEQAAQSTQVYRLRLRMLRAEDGTHWVEESGVVVPQADGGWIVHALLQDIKEQVQHEEELLAAQVRYQLIFEQCPIGIFQTTLKGSYLSVNPSLARLYGFSSPEEMIRSFEDIGTELYVNPYRRHEFAAALARDGRIDDFESEIRLKNGATLWISEHAHLVTDGQGNPLYYEGTVEDITIRREAEQLQQARESFLHQIVEGSPVPTFVLDREHRVTHWNHALVRLTGVTAEDVLGTRGAWKGFYANPRATLADMVLDGWSEADAKRYYPQDVKRPSSKKAGLESEQWLPDYAPANLLHMTATPIYDVDGVIIGAIETLDDMTEMWRNRQELERRATIDSLTGLPNRNVLSLKFQEAARRADLEGCYCLVCFVDLDNFKVVNDSLGHAAGDDMLIQVSRRILQGLRSTDVVVRYGGDEFIILMGGHYRSSTVHQTMQRLLRTVSAPLVLEDREFYPSCSVGIARYPFDGSELDTLLKHADAAMYEAKSQGKNRYQICTQEMQSKATDRFDLEVALREAIANDLIQAWFQPCFDREGGLIGVEALARWQDGERGMVRPDRFIPLAEELGLIDPLTQIILEKTCQALRKWTDLGVPDLVAGVNLSVSSLNARSGLDMIRECLEKYKIQPKQLRIEITESVLMENVEEHLFALHSIRNMGIEIALDDFDTGYSSIAYLVQLPIDVLKIDRSILQNVCDNPQAARVVQGLVRFGHEIGLDVVAEGVEDSAQLKVLKQLGYDEFQGFFYSPALALNEFTKKYISHK